LHYQLVTTTPKAYADGTLTKELIRITEESIRRQPSDYLWSHRRWKWKFSDEYQNLLVK
jgi:Kdo2-lipid IVA lauroyltransferase/acyltransferase